ncbi:hypothetical protein DSM03_102530 [Leeuwenhoekiella aestuarii]|uniref:Uncharacterized protein n=1 Tax=Leeuwenhoekiella aestuarii TaxID=2249426 RepID=A0A4Q0NVX8_9FLAO|nr:hypothetical protein DSM04_103124 [Leeuwenhoekiella aestuarii]RXG15237.1 hypothetical protein DSM04_103125 [Leeuwenhoekiella aestuarii]RXG17653.1 hypothetical protein DSM03_102530 [Leeuwenhoekiella aestuarii]
MGTSCYTEEKEDQRLKLVVTSNIYKPEFIYLKNAY